MILLFNVYITNSSFNIPYQRENAKNYDKLDIYKYTLASYANYYDWSKVIINTKLDDQYENRREELNSFIYDIFESKNLIVRNTRNEFKDDWQKEYENLTDDLIFYNGNHDHPVIDFEKTYFKNFVDEISNIDEDFYSMTSHFPEWLEIFFKCNYNIKSNYESIELKKNYLSLIIKEVYSCGILKNNLYKNIWFNDKLPNLSWIRLDLLDQNVGMYKDKIHLTIVPMKEICRHFDGYQHIGPKFNNHYWPVLEIPEGFFNNNININYSCDYVDNMTNINPLSTELKIYNKNGFDFNMPKKYIPHFWNSRIKKFDNKISVDSKYLQEIYVENIINNLKSSADNGLCPSALQIYENVKNIYYN